MEAMLQRLAEDRLDAWWQSVTRSDTRFVREILLAGTSAAACEVELFSTYYHKLQKQSKAKQSNGPRFQVNNA